MHPRIAVPLLLAGAAVIFACSSTTASNAPVEGPDASTPVEEAGTEDAAPVDAGKKEAAAPPDPSPDPLVGCTRDPGAPAGTVDPNAATDPTGGAAMFTLAQALAGFPAGGGKLTAAIRTERKAKVPGSRSFIHSSITCELLETDAPISVANFVGLARGTRPFKDAAGKWKLARFYDGLTWHRVIPKFVIQGGDPDGDGTGGPGFDLINENHIDEPLGTLAMAASNKPSGSQFYIVVGKGPAPNYNVFGTCTTAAAAAIAAVARDTDDLPTTPVHMLKIEIARCP